MPNPRKDNVRIEARLDRNLMVKLRLLRPELFIPSLESIQFKHGGASRYIAMLINEDLSQAEKPNEQD